MLWRPGSLRGYRARSDAPAPRALGLGAAKLSALPATGNHSRMPTIGVISDTHGLLRQEALAALEGSDLILHAGDVGDRGIIDRLSDIAAVWAVRGNTDHGALARSLPETQVVDLTSGAGPYAYVIHQLELLDLDPVAAGLRVVIYGHTHVPHIELRSDVLYFNPGAAGHRRFRLPVTVGRLIVEEDDIDAEIIHLDVVGI